MKMKIEWKLCENKKPCCVLHPRQEFEERMVCYIGWVNKDIKKWLESLWPNSFYQVIFICKVEVKIRLWRNEEQIGGEETKKIWLSLVKSLTIRNIYILKGVSVQFTSLQLLSGVRLFATPWIAARQASLSITNSQSLPKLMSIESVMPSPLSSPSPPAPNPSQHQGLFQWVNSSHEVAKVLEFQLQHQTFQWTPRTDLL